MERKKSKGKKTEAHKMEQQCYLKVIHHSHTIHKIFVENEECAKKEVLKTCQINWYPPCRISTEIFQPFFGMLSFKIIKCIVFSDGINAASRSIFNVSFLLYGANV